MRYETKKFNAVLDRLIIEGARMQDDRGLTATCTATADLDDLITGDMAVAAVWLTLDSDDLSEFDNMTLGMRAHSRAMEAARLDMIADEDKRIAWAEAHA